MHYAVPLHLPRPALLRAAPTADQSSRFKAAIARLRETDSRTRASTRHSHRKRHRLVPYSVISNKSAFVSRISLGAIQWSTHNIGFSHTHIVSKTEAFEAEKCYC
ncbi:hypothetical protein MSG28_000704 [Choristoneura fumiferana]|uniref:Uncharacterized protein n=1 Tax=Choristoneura fumiferana TaxID=7141 RepID=A0ACC0K2F2_CHOFU|nr:hypothetical protein MSG28_000704 [Choristoneura fumiferana]